MLDLGQDGGQIVLQHDTATTRAGRPDRPDPIQGQCRLTDHQHRRQPLALQPGVTQVFAFKKDTGIVTPRPALGQTQPAAVIRIVA